MLKNLSQRKIQKGFLQIFDKSGKEVSQNLLNEHNRNWFHLLKSRAVLPTGKRITLNYFKLPKRPKSSIITFKKNKIIKRSFQNVSSKLKKMLESDVKLNVISKMVEI